METSVFGLEKITLNEINRLEVQSQSDYIANKDHETERERVQIDNHKA